MLRNEKHFVLLAVVLFSIGDVQGKLQLYIFGVLKKREGYNLGSPTPEDAGIGGTKPEEAETCREIINNDGPQANQGLAIAADSMSQIFMITNNSASVAAAVDPKTDMYLLWNGNTGFITVVDIMNQRVVSVTPEQSPLAYTRDAYSNPLGNFFDTVPSLAIYFEIPGLEVHNFDDIPQRDAEQGNEIMMYLIGEPLLSLQGDNLNGLNLSIKLFQTLINLLNGSLSGTSQYMNGKLISGDLIMLVKVLQLLGTIISFEFSS